MGPDLTPSRVQRRLGPGPLTPVPLPRYPERLIGLSKATGPPSMEGNRKGPDVKEDSLSSNLGFLHLLAV